MLNICFNTKFRIPIVTQLFHNQRLYATQSFNQTLLQVKTILEDIESSIELIKKSVDDSLIKNQIKEIDSEFTTELWSTNQKRAVYLNRTKTHLEKILEGKGLILEKFQENNSILELAQVERDDALLKQVELDLQELLSASNSFFVKILMNKDSDSSNCFIEIRAGAGGTDACDFVEELARFPFFNIECIQGGPKSKILSAKNSIVTVAMWDIEVFHCKLKENTLTVGPNTSLEYIAESVILNTMHQAKDIQVLHLFKSSPLRHRKNRWRLK